eukprot:jgi/Botrbrau1/20052/Bobra.200_1s0057.1
MSQFRTVTGSQDTRMWAWPRCPAISVLIPSDSLQLSPFSFPLTHSLTLSPLSLSRTHSLQLSPLSFSLTPSSYSFVLLPSDALQLSLSSIPLTSFINLRSHAL